MPDKKLTDNEIIKTLQEMADYPHNYEEGQDLQNALDLINRLQAENEKLRTEDWKSLSAIIETQRAEIKQWKKEANRYQNWWSEAISRIATAKAEAYKEFAERLKEQKYQSSDWSHGEHPFVVEESDIDNTLYELVGDEP